MTVVGAEARSTAVVDQCPAFMEGCPFSKFDSKALPRILGSNRLLDGCVAFKDGCPFRGEESVESLYNRLAEMPASHRVAETTEAARAVSDVLQAVHEQSKALKGQLGTQSPVFATSCPFKTVTSAGEPLVKELDMVAAWTLADEIVVDSCGNEPLSKYLKAGTKNVHRAAENVRFVRDFLSGNVPQKSYVSLLTALYYVYDAMETGLEQLPQQYRHFDFSLLRRTDALLADLRHHTQVPDGSLKLVPASTAALQFAQRLKRLASERPLLLLAHAYTRYMGDLSGGQILSKAATKAYGPGGTAFYLFEHVGGSATQLKAFKKRYRASLDELCVGAAEADALVDEANSSFLMNMLLFEERDVAAISPE